MKPVAIVRSLAVAVAASSICAAALANPVTYKLDPNHTHPMFATDHMGGLSVWRGFITDTHGKVVLDREAETGTVHVTMDMGSVDFGNAQLNKDSQSPGILNVAKYPTATYTGKLVDWENGEPTAVNGKLTLHGVTKPVDLKIDSFMCKMAMGHQRCGADAIGHIQRNEFGIGFGKKMGFKMGVTLRIQVEGVKQD